MRIVVEGEQTEFACRPQQTLLAAALDAGVDWPHGCRVGMCGRCRCQVVDGKTKALNPYEPVLTPGEVADGHVLACRALPITDVHVSSSHIKRLRSDREKASVAKIAAIEALTPLVTSLTVEFVEDSPVWEAGQYASLSVPGVVDGRNFSFAGACRGDGFATFVVRRFDGGLFSDWLGRVAEIGSTVTVGPPIGQYHLRQIPDPLLCLCAGTGIAPVLAILEEIVSGAFSPRVVRVVIAARDKEHLVGLDRLQRLAKRWPIDGGFELVPVLSRQNEPAPDVLELDVLKANFLEGHLFDHFERLLEGFRNATVLMAGPPGLVEATELQLLKAGFASDQLIIDRFLPAWH